MKLGEATPSEMSTPIRNWLQMERHYIIVFAENHRQGTLTREQE